MLYRSRRVAWVLPVLGFVFLSSVPAGDEFPSRNVELMGQLRMRTFGSGSDCWGYTSPSGREYALVGFNRGVVVAEVTAPTKPRVVQTFVGVSSVWRDIKVYRDHAYVSNEERGGLLIFDLSEIDRGLIATSETLEGGHTSHNLAVDEVSGFLYRLANTRPQDGMNVFDVSTPGEPQLVGSWHDRYIHDAQVVTYTSGKFQGRQIAFCAANRTPGGGSPRLDVLDVTDKSDIRRIDSVQYDGSVFAHQVWLTEDRRYLYLNDELDEIERRTRTRGFIFDVEDVDNPRYLRSFTNGSRAVDHNMYVDGDLLFAANYRSGLRLFDISTPTEPQEIGFFDTYPPNDNADIGGLWSAYPFLPSGTVIGSDRDEGILLFWAGLDEDEDGIADRVERRNGLDPKNPNDASDDPDGDGLSSRRELEEGTDPRVADTDGDGLEDGEEVEAGLIPYAADTDGDGLDDGVETGSGKFRGPDDTGTDPLDPDTDGGGLNDGEEVAKGLDPNNPVDDDTDTVITFDELPPQPVNGLSHLGVTFEFTQDGDSSDEATFGGRVPPNVESVEGLGLEGPTNGELALTFAIRPSLLSFGFALSSTRTIEEACSVVLLGTGGETIHESSVTAAPESSSSEALFSYEGKPFTQAVIRFRSEAASRFILDNLRFNFFGQIRDETFRRGDANWDAIVDLSDAIYILSYFFQGGDIPTCIDAVDANDDEATDLSDPITILVWRFGGGEPPPAPGPTGCGEDPTGEQLSCEEPAACQ